MTPEQRGKILAHLMLGELEKIANKTPIKRMLGSLLPIKNKPLPSMVKFPGLPTSHGVGSPKSLANRADAYRAIAQNAKNKPGFRRITFNQPNSIEGGQALTDEIKKLQVGKISPEAQLASQKGRNATPAASQKGRNARPAEIEELQEFIKSKGEGNQIPKSAPKKAKTPTSIVGKDRIGDAPPLGVRPKNKAENIIPNKAPQGNQPGKAQQAAVPPEGAPLERLSPNAKGLLRQAQTTENLHHKKAIMEALKKNHPEDYKLFTQQQQGFNDMTEAVGQKWRTVSTPKTGKPPVSQPPIPQTNKPTVTNPVQPNPVQQHKQEMGLPSGPPKGKVPGDSGLNDGQGGSRFFSENEVKLPQDIAREGRKDLRNQGALVPKGKVSPQVAAQKEHEAAAKKGRELFSSNPREAIDNLIGDQSIDMGNLRNRLYNEAGGGLVTGQLAKEVAANPELAQKLQRAGLVLDPNLGDDVGRKISNFRLKEHPGLNDLPAGEFTPEQAKLFGKDRLAFEGDVVTFRGEAAGKVVDGKVKIFTPEERSSQKFKDYFLGSENTAPRKNAFGEVSYSQGGKIRQQELEALAPGAQISGDDFAALQANRSKMGGDMPEFKTLDWGGDKYIYDNTGNKIIGRRSVDGGIVGVNPVEVEVLQTRMNEYKKADLLKNNPPQGSNGTYSTEQLKTMGEAEKRLIPFSEGGRKVETLDDFKRLESEAQEADRLYNQAYAMRGQGAEYANQLAEIKAARLKLRNEYRNAREGLSASMLKRRQSQIGAGSIVDEAPEIESALKYLEERKVPFFNSTPLKGTEKGYKTPPTPGGILGDASPAMKAVGLGAVGLGAYGLMTSGQKKPDYSAQGYGQY